MKVLIAGGGTGGHLMPALAIADALRGIEPDAEVLLVGSERGIEQQVLPHHAYPYRLLPLGPLYRAQWWRNARWIGLAWRLLRAVDALLDAERPDVVVSTGGYAAGPVVWRAQRRGIPTAVQEQNAFPGLTTRWLSRRARHIYLGWREARLHPGRNTRVFAYGNPIRPPDLNGTDRSVMLRQVGISATGPCVLVFGGSQGSTLLNGAIAEALELKLFQGISLLWGTGSPNAARLSRYAVPGKIVVQGFFDPIAPAYRAADLIVSRAGAMTLAELCAWGKPSVLVPLATAAADHQTFNARAMADAGAAILLPQSELGATGLGRLVSTLVTKRERLASMSQAARARGQPDAAREIARSIVSLARSA
jgi:UDP-N-acetylglucosamine--N-acetylmuramyl-(pentapeptide) pyrophosphoryl-undecaprenol N-acetylglucosamine transferase